MFQINLSYSLENNPLVSNLCEKRFGHARTGNRTEGASEGAPLISDVTDMITYRHTTRADGGKPTRNLSLIFCADRQSIFDVTKTYSTKEAAKLLGFRSPSTLRDDAVCNKIPGAFKCGKSWRIPHEYVQRRLAEESNFTPNKNRVGRKRGRVIKS